MKAPEKERVAPAPEQSEALQEDDAARLRSQLALGQKSRRAVAGVGFGCLGIGWAVGIILATSGELMGAIIFPVLLTPTGALFIWLASRARRTIEQDLAEGTVAVMEGTVQAKRQMQLPRGEAYSLRVDGRDVFVNATVFAQLTQGDRIRIRRAPHSGIALATEKMSADGEVTPLGET